MRFQFSLRSGALIPTVGFVALLAGASALSAQTTSPTGAAMTHTMGESGHQDAGWKELDAFHAVMAAGWHPAMMDSLAPARASAPKLVAAAKVLAKAKAPMGCEAPEVKTAIVRLTAESEAVAKLVSQKAADAAVKAALKTVHDTFEVVEAKCKPMKH